MTEASSICSAQRPVCPKILFGAVQRLRLAPGSGLRAKTQVCLMGCNGESRARKMKWNLELYGGFTRRCSPLINQPPSLNRGCFRDPDIEALKGVINQGSALWSGKGPGDKQTISYSPLSIKMVGVQGLMIRSLQMKQSDGACPSQQPWNPNSIVSSRHASNAEPLIRIPFIA